MIRVLTTIGKQEYPNGNSWLIEGDRLIIIQKVAIGSGTWQTKKIAEFQPHIWVAVEEAE